MRGCSPLSGRNDYRGEHCAKDVAAAVASAQDGDTVLIPAGTQPGPLD